jgi:hypothetical protein
MMSSKNNITICPTCGQKIVQYKHGLNRTLISCLWNLYRAGGRARIDKLGLENTQFTNFQKLRYFHLVVMTNQHNEWQITRDGLEFIQGRKAIWKFVITKNASVIERSQELVFIHEVKDCVQYKIEWRTQAAQPTLFDHEDKQ